MCISNMAKCVSGVRGQVCIKAKELGGNQCLESGYPLQLTMVYIVNHFDTIHPRCISGIWCVICIMAKWSYVYQG